MVWTVGGLEWVELPRGAPNPGPLSPSLPKRRIRRRRRQHGCPRGVDVIGDLARQGRHPPQERRRGASLESLVKGAVCFSRKFTLQELYWIVGIHCYMTQRSQRKRLLGWLSMRLNFPLPTLPRHISFSTQKQRILHFRNRK